MDPENQDRIKSLVDEHGADDVVVVLGAADLEALEVAAETLTLGDPAYVGSLAGVQLGLPVVHILEEDVKEQVDPEVYDEQVGLLEMTLDVDRVRRAAEKFLGGTEADLSARWPAGALMFAAVVAAAVAALPSSSGFLVTKAWEAGAGRSQSRSRRARSPRSSGAHASGDGGATRRSGNSRSCGRSRGRTPA